MSTLASSDIKYILNNKHNFSEFGEGLLTNRISEKFSSERKQLFAKSFLLFTQYNENDFVISLEIAWKWLEFSRKDPIKRLMESKLIKNKEYAINISPPIGGAVFEENTSKAAPPNCGAAFEENTSKNLGGAGQNKEYILLTVRGFKKLCLLANTSVANEILEYYLDLENVMLDIVLEEKNVIETKLIQITDEKNKVIENQNKLIKKQKKDILDSYDGESLVYGGFSEKGIIKSGSTDYGKERLNEHKRFITKDFEYDAFIKKTPYNREVEQMIKDDPLCSQFRISKQYNHFDTDGTPIPCTELWVISKKLTLNMFIKKVEGFISGMNDKEMVIKFRKEIQELTDKQDPKNDEDILILKNKIKMAEKIIQEKDNKIKELEDMLLLEKIKNLELTKKNIDQEIELIKYKRNNSPTSPTSPTSQTKNNKPQEKFSSKNLISQERERVRLISLELSKDVVQKQIEQIEINKKLLDLPNKINVNGDICSIDRNFMQWLNKNIEYKLGGVVGIKTIIRNYKTTISKRRTPHKKYHKEQVILFLKIKFPHITMKTRTHKLQINDDGTMKTIDGWKHITMSI